MRMICTTRSLCSRFQQIPAQIPAVNAKFDAIVKSLTPQGNVARDDSPKQPPKTKSCSKTVASAAQALA